MENERHRLAVVVAGYPAEMKRFLAANQGLTGRFTEVIHIDDYGPDELFDIFTRMIDVQGLRVDPQAAGAVRRLVAGMYKSRFDEQYFRVAENGHSEYDNARAVRRLVQAMQVRQAYRLRGESSPDLIEADIPEKFRPFLSITEDEGTSLEGLLEQLDALVGLDPVKEVVRRLVREQRLVSAGVEPVVGATRHMAFVGNPGTGKTTVAELLGKILRTLGLLKKGHVRYAERKDLVAEHMGQSAPRTHRVIESALDGVLFIDEAHALLTDERDAFGKEALRTLVPAMESQRGRLVVILAGYTREMEQLFSGDSGVRSRLAEVIEFPDYEPAEMLRIFLAFADKDGFGVSADASQAAGVLLTALHQNRGPQFGNGRDVRVKLYQPAVDSYRKRLLDFIDQGGDRGSFPKELIASDIPTVSAPMSAPVRARRFRVSDIDPFQVHAAPNADAPAEITAVVSTSVGLVKTERGSGTGFAISPVGHILTAHHVVAGSRSIRFRFGASTAFLDAVHLESDEATDIAVLRIDGSELPYARLAEPSRTLSPGCELGLLGYPFGEGLGAAPSYTNGVLSAVRGVGGVRRLQIDVRAYKGNSGGPVFLLETGDVIGILVSGPNDTLNFAASVADLYERFA